MKTILASMTNLDGFEDVIKTASALASIYDGHVIGHYPIPEGSAMALAFSFHPKASNSKGLLLY